MEVDAFMVLLVAILLFSGARLPAFILVAGAMRYVYVLLLMLAPRDAPEAPPSRWGRHVFSLMVVSLAASAWPLPHHRVLAAVASLCLVASFARSSWWSLGRR